MAGIGTGKRALLTTIRPLSGVRANVNLQRAQIAELLVAHAARVRANVGVHERVHAQTGRVPERPPADAAGVRHFVRVTAHVRLEAAAVRKTAVADEAGQVSLSSAGMRVKVLLEVACVDETFVAHHADVRTLTWVKHKNRHSVRRGANMRHQKHRKMFADTLTILPTIM